MKNELTKEEKQVQKILNKIMSEELLAHMFYMGCTVATCKCESEIFDTLFIEIANDELNDHFLKLKSWALANDFSVPYKLKDYMKFAENDAKRLDSLKNDEKAAYYVDQAIKSEEDAIKSYEEALKTEFLPYELQALLLHNYYDEIEHLEKLTTIKYALDAFVQLKIEY